MPNDENLKRQEEAAAYEETFAREQEHAVCQRRLTG